MDGWMDGYMDGRGDREGGNAKGGQSRRGSLEATEPRKTFGCHRFRSERTNERASERAASPSIRSNSHGSVAQPSANACPVNCLAFNYHE